MEYLRETKSCTVCGSDSNSTVYSWPANYFDHLKYETCSWDGRQPIDLKIVRCRSCRHMYTSPAFKESALHHLYPSDIIPDSLQTVRENIESKKYLDFADTVSNYFEPENTVCDIGTRYGGLPHHLEKRGFTAFGIDYSEEAVSRGQACGAPVHCGVVRDVPSLVKRIGHALPSIFTMDDVSEHLAYPRRDFQLIFDSLPPGGGLVSRQMNSLSLGHKLFRRNWYYLQPGAHMNYFSPDSLGKLLSDIGFSVVTVETPNTLTNLARTAYRSLGRRARKLVLRRCSPNASSSAESSDPRRRMYLLDRRRSADDMFTIVCKKPKN